MAHLAGGDELGHRGHGLLDRGLEVDAVLVVEVDVVDAEALERRVARVPDVVAVAADAEPLALLAADVAELRRDDDLVAASDDRTADEPLVRQRAVHVGRVEERDAELESPVDGRDRLVVVSRAVELGHAHAAEPERGDGQSLCPECACVHASTLPARDGTTRRQNSGSDPGKCPNGTRRS